MANGTFLRHSERFEKFRAKAMAEGYKIIGVEDNFTLILEAVGDLPRRQLVCRWDGIFKVEPDGEYVRLCQGTADEWIDTSLDAGAYVPGFTLPRS
jgi:hypothetical protein